MATPVENGCERHLFLIVLKALPRTLELLHPVLLAANILAYPLLAGSVIRQLD